MVYGLFVRLLPEYIILQKFISEMDDVLDRTLCVASTGLRPKRLSAAQFVVSVFQLPCGFIDECI